MSEELIDIARSEINFMRLKNNVAHIGHAHIVVCQDPAIAAQFCREIIKEILIQNGHKDLAEKVDHGTYVDVSEIKNESTIKVADIQPIIDKSSETGIESDYRFYIISKAENLSVESQNKLLKTLEEPNKNQFYFLCVPSRFLLLQTIISRCNCIELSQGNKSKIEESLISRGVDSIKAQQMAELSLGSYEKAQNNASSENFYVALSALTKIISSASTAEYAIKIQKSDIQQVVSYLEFLILDAIKIKNDISDIWFKSNYDSLLKLKTCSLGGLLLIYNQLQKIKELLRVNVSAAVLADKIVLSIAEGKNKK